MSKPFGDFLLDMLSNFLLVGDKSISCRLKLLLLLLLHSDLVSKLGSDTNFFVEEVHLLFLVLKHLLMPLKHGLISLQINFSCLQRALKFFNL